MNNSLIPKFVCKNIPGHPVIECNIDIETERQKTEIQKDDKTKYDE